MIATGRLLLIATAVRTAYLAASLLLASFLDDYDTSNALLSESCDHSWPEVVARTQEDHPLVLWDAVFLQRISSCGYEYEQYFAFFPGLPGLIHLIRKAGVLSGPHAFSIITLLLNNGLFLLSVLLLARLSKKFLQDDHLAVTAVLFFIASPASIHHSLLYTEALFTATSWLGLYCLYCRGSSVGASLAFAVSSATRSNGLLNAGFILHEHGRRAIKSWQHDKVAAASHAAQGAVYAAIAMAPYFIYTAYGYQMFCTGVYGDGKQRPWCSKLLPSAYGYVQDAYWDVGLFRYYRASQIPNFLIALPTLMISLWGALAYMCAVPHTFLSGGLLSAQQLAKWFSSSSSNNRNRGSDSRMHQSSQADVGNSRAVGSSFGCMMLHTVVVENAGPAVAVGCNVSRKQKAIGAGGPEPRAGATAEGAVDVQQMKIPGVAYQQLRQRQTNPTDTLNTQNSVATPAAANSENSSGVPVRCQQCTCGLGIGYYSPRVAVFVIHWLLLTLVCLAVMHIQVATRFLSSCVPLYWFAALLMTEKGGLLRWLLWLYCFAFMGLGGVYFPNFYPWT